MATELTGLRPPRPDPPKPVCAACGPTWNASRGFPGGIAYCPEHVPPHLRFPWEPGYAAVAVEAEPATAALAPALAPAPAPTAQVVPFPVRAARTAATGAFAPDLFGSLPA